MKATLEKVSNLERKLNIQIPADEVSKAFESAFQSIQKHVAIKGFRKGKAPMKAVKSMYGDRVKQDVVNDLVQKFYASALREHSLEPISFPTIEFDALDENKDFEFTAEFEVRPEVQLKKLEKLKVKRERFEMKPGFVESTLEDIRQGRASTAPLLIERPAQKGDIAVIDFKGYLLEGELPNGAAEDHQLELGSNSFIPGFEEGIIGMTVGVTSEIKLQFPDGYHAAELSGKPVTFKVTLKKLLKKDLPELNDEFAKSLGGKYETLEDLKKAITEDYEKREQKRIKDDLKNRLVRALVDANPVEVPKSLLNEQKQALIEDLKNRMSQQGMSQEQFEDYKSKWDSDFNETASYMIRSSFLIDRVAMEKNLKATEKDLDAKLEEYAQQTGIELPRVMEFYNQEDRRSRLRYQLTEERVMDWLTSVADLEEVSREELEKESDAN
ncbi:MAG TPA: trigger factor [Pseudobdellovibrionaceae bacterium]|nr:trigger factor [Pseudobdellovibrionaceae bacterium]